MASDKSLQFYDDVEELVDLRSIWVGLRRRAGLFAAIVSTVFMGVVAFTFLSTELYTAETSLMIQPKTEAFAYGEDIFPKLSADPAMVDTEVELLRSRAMAIRVADRLRFEGEKTATDNPDGTQDETQDGKKDGEDFFARRLAAVAADLAELQSSRALTAPGGVAAKDGASNETGGAASAAADGAGIVEAIAAEAARPALSPEAAAKIESAPGIDQSAKEQLRPSNRRIEQILKNLEIQRVGDTFLIKIRYSSPSAAEAAKIANAYAEEYILQQLEAQYISLRQANKWIDARLATLRVEVRSAEEAAAQYRAEQGLVDVTGSSFSEKALAGIATELAAARTNLASLRARFNTVNSLASSDAPVESISEVLSSAVITDLRRQQAEISRRRAELNVRYGDRHPELKKIAEESGGLNAQLDREVQRIVDGLRAEVGFAAAQVRSLEDSMQKAQSELASNNAAGVELMELERDIEATRGVYEALLNRQKELNERDRLADANARIIAAAEPPEKPSKPQKKLLLAGGLMLALLLGGASSFAAEALDTRIKNTHDIRREFGPSAPVVLIPRIQSRLLFRQRKSDDVVRRYLMDEPDSAFAESLRDLRLHLKGAEREIEGPVAIAFASAFKGEGRTTTAFAFASLLASGGKRVAFINFMNGGNRYFEAASGERETNEGEGDTPLLGSRDSELLQIEAQAPASKPSTESNAGDLVSGLRGKAMTAQAQAPGSSSVTEYEMKPAKKVCGVTLIEFKSGVRLFDEFDLGAFEATLAKLRKEFDYIILDTPAVFAKPEASVTAAAADFTVLVTEWCVTTRGAARAVAQRLMDARARILSFAIVKVDEKQRYYFRPEDRQYYFHRPH